VQVSAEIAHRLPDWFESPDTYDPLRFAPERAEDKADRFTLIGFGGGGHKCMGMNFANNEIAVITALLLQQFELELITRDPGIARGVGANKPMTAIVRYRRKQLTAPAERAETTAAGCPVHAL